MGNLGFTEILIILLVVLLVFGAKRLPEVGASIGKGIREFKRSLSDTQDSIMRGDDAAGQLPPRHLDPNASAQPQNTAEPKRLSQ
jgi:sec-independent protein translocase protein TatA